MKTMNRKMAAPTNNIAGWLTQTTVMTMTNRLNWHRAFQSATSAFGQEKNSKVFMKQINAVGALFAIAAAIGVASAQTPPLFSPQCLVQFCPTPFMIVSVSSGLVIGLPGSSTTPGTPIQQEPANGGTDQQWTFRRVSVANPGVYEIVSLSSGQVLDVPGFSTTPGKLIQQWPANGGTNQQWGFSRAPGSSGYEILSVDQDCPPPPPGQFGGCFFLVLDVPGFATTPDHIQQWTENNGTNQQWLLHPMALRNISMAPGNGAIEITGWGFTPGTVACPVVPVLRQNPPAACATVLANGTFSTSVFFDGFWFDSAGPGYTVATIENQAGNVLAIGSMLGTLSPALQ